MKILTKETCEHCEPYKINSFHIGERILNTPVFYIIQELFRSLDLSLQKKFPRLCCSAKKFIWNILFKSAKFSRILQEIEICDGDKNFNNRTLIVVRAARLRDIKIKSLEFFGRVKTNFFIAVVQGEKKIFEGLPSLNIERFFPVNFDDKSILKQILKNHELPFADGQAFSDKKSALVYAKKIGFPLVVKPQEGSLSKHATCNIESEDALCEAIRIAQIISRKFILEKHISGEVYRITTIGNKVIACCLREPPNIIGDGMHTIKELINIKNDNPLRGNINEKGFTLYKIGINKQAISLLKRSGLTLDSVPPINYKVYLHNKVVLSCGADIHDKTDNVHPDNNLIFEKLAYLLQSPIIGIDFICQDISKPYYKQECAIIETNSLPYIDMHHFPISGKPRDVAGYLIDYFLLGNKN